MAKGSVFDNGGYVGVKGTQNNPGVWSLGSAYDSKVSPLLVTSGLLLNLDAANPASYPGSGTIWTDLSGNNNNFVLNNAAAYTSGATPYMNFESYFSTTASGVNFGPHANVTIMAFSTIKNTTSDWRTLLRGSSYNHQIIIQSDNQLGLYDQDKGGNFQSSGFYITSLPNPYTQFNCLTWRMSQSSPYYQFSYNANPTTYNITSSYASYTQGFYCLGAYQGGSQFWGKLAVFLYYNRQLTDAEITQNYNVYKSRFGL